MSQQCVTDRPQKILAQIERIELLMKQADLFCSQKPSAQAFKSELPFCYDTMSFLEWLQWVMFPKTREMIDKNLPLPTVCEIHPLAEEEFKLFSQKTDALQAEILVLDQLFNVAH